MGKHWSVEDKANLILIVQSAPSITEGFDKASDVFGRSRDSVIKQYYKQVKQSDDGLGFSVYGCLDCGILEIVTEASQNYFNGSDMCQKCLSDNMVHIHSGYMYGLSEFRKAREKK